MTWNLLNFWTKNELRYHLWKKIKNVFKPRGSKVFNFFIIINIIIALHDH
jgi:hypothetical protein